MKVFKDEKGVVRAEMTFEEMRQNGVLWWINRVAFHPRGFALAMSQQFQTVEVWGNGVEPWTFDEEVDNNHLTALENLFTLIKDGAEELDVLESVVIEDSEDDPAADPEVEIEIKVSDDPHEVQDVLEQETKIVADPENHRFTEGLSATECDVCGKPPSAHGH